MELQRKIACAINEVPIDIPCVVHIPDLEDITSGGTPFIEPAHDRYTTRKPTRQDYIDAACGALRAASIPTQPGVRRWYLGSQNDGLFIIDMPPRPSNDDQWHDRPDGPSLVIPLGAMSREKAQAIVDAHNEAILAAEPVGPVLWGRAPKTGEWQQIDDGSHTAEEVAAFEATYMAAGWTDLRRSNPFATEADAKVPAITPASTNGGEAVATDRAMRGCEPCGWSDCGCDFDAKCSDAPPAVPGEVTDEMVERFRAELEELADVHLTGQLVKRCLTAALKAGE